jgi:hypothetical protein
MEPEIWTYWQRPNTAPLYWARWIQFTATLHFFNIYINTSLSFTPIPPKKPTNLSYEFHSVTQTIFLHCYDTHMEICNVRVLRRRHSIEPELCTFFFFFFLSRQFNSGLGRLVSEICRVDRDTHNRLGSFKGVISLSQKSLYPYNTRDEHRCLGGIRTRDPSNQAASDLRLKPHGHRDLLHHLTLERTKLQIHWPLSMDWDLLNLMDPTDVS